MYRLALLVALAGLSGCSGICANSIEGRVASQDGKHIAVISTTHCGPESAYSTLVSLIGPQERVPNNATVFEIQGTVRSTDFLHGRTSGPWVDVEWVAQNRLLIRYDRRFQIVSKTGKVDGVTITYLSVAA